MKKIYLTLIIALTVKGYSQTNCSVAISYTAPTCPSCCDGTVSVQVMESSCAPYQYIWNPSLVAGTTNVCAGSYTCVVQDAGGASCCGTMTGTVTIPNGNIATGIYQNKNSRGQVMVYPNPNSGTINLQSTTELGSVTIYNNLGQLIYSQAIKDTNTQIDIGEYASGIYLVKVQNEYVKIIKQ